MGGVVERPTVALACADEVIRAAVANASALGIAVSVFVIDESGVMKAAARMDGALLVSVDAARQKAYTAVANNAPTAVIAEHLGSEAAEATAFASLPGMTALAGGFPLHAAGRLVGAVGVSGGSLEQDDMIAEAASKTLSERP
jgi:uncharacterized protein GlcG (DUF336 family)